MKILLFPSDFGGGYGHISRCLAIANDAKERGHLCAFVLNEKKYEMHLKGKEYKVFIPTQNIKSKTLPSILKWKIINTFYKNPTPVFTEITNLDFQAYRDGFFDRNFVVNIIESYVKIANYYRPDLIIGDTNLLVWILSRRIKVPVVQIIRLASHPDNGSIIWWKDIDKSIKPPDSSKIFNPILKAFGINKIYKAEELLQGDMYIIPSIPDIEPIKIEKNSYYTGELTIHYNWRRRWKCW